MSLTFRWVGEDELDRVAQTRLYSYAPAARDLEKFKENVRRDRRAKPGDFLLAERNGEAVGTTTSLSMTMWVRGAPLPCQGVAYVGTIKTARRGGSSSQKQQRGIASQIMDHSLRKARERGQVVSALMPFRASFYEHFGYGLVERRHEWTVPMSVLPAGDFDGFRFVRDDADADAMIDCRRRAVEAGQCDIERSREGWDIYRHYATEGYEVIDRAADGSARGFLVFSDEMIDGRKFVHVEDQGYDSLESLRRQLHFLASLKDQYSGAIVTLPNDVPLNLLLRESQLPHRIVEHGVAKLRTITRMQVRVLDHKRFLEALKLPPQHTAGKVNVAVHESEGTVSKFRVEIADGRARVTPTNDSPDVECPDKTWAAIACGALSATDAARFGLIKTSGSAGGTRVLDALAVGPAPFCGEYF